MTRAPRDFAPPQLWPRLTPHSTAIFQPHPRLAAQPQAMEPRPVGPHGPTDPRPTDRRTDRQTDRQTDRPTTPQQRHVAQHGGSPRPPRSEPPSHPHRPSAPPRCTDSPGTPGTGAAPGALHHSGCYGDKAPRRTGQRTAPPPTLSPRPSPRRYPPLRRRRRPSPRRSAPPTGSSAAPRRTLSPPPALLLR